MNETTLDPALSAVPEVQSAYRSSSSIDVYTSGAMQMDCFHNAKAYPCLMCAGGVTDFVTGQPRNIWEPQSERGIGSTGSGFESGSLGNIGRTDDFGNMLGDKGLSGYGLTERYDFSGHNGLLPHLNQDVVGPNNDPGINSGTSRKSEDGFKGLGLPHRIDLFGDV